MDCDSIPRGPQQQPDHNHKARANSMGSSARDCFVTGPDGGCGWFCCSTTIHSIVLWFQCSACPADHPTNHDYVFSTSPRNPAHPVTCLFLPGNSIIDVIYRTRAPTTVLGLHLHVVSRVCKLIQLAFKSGAP